MLAYIMLYVFSRPRRYGFVLGKATLLFVLLTVVKYYISMHNENSLNPSRLFADNEIEAKAGGYDERDMLARDARDDVDAAYQRQRLELLASLNTKLMNIVSRFVSGDVREVIIPDLPDYCNKGDSALAMGELNVLAQIGATISYALRFNLHEDVYVRIKNEMNITSPSQIAILAQGGGNIGLYGMLDKAREIAFNAFSNSTLAVMSQSVYIPDEHAAELARQRYGHFKHLSFMLRDEASYINVSNYLPQVTPILAPDMAFGLGHIDQFFPPSLDIIWIHRQDKEQTSSFINPQFPPHVSFYVTDWKKDFQAPKFKPQHVAEKILLRTTTGYMFLQRGKVLVTDRLHGHIVALLLNIPTVIIDNKIHKLTHFRETWTAELNEYIMVAENVTDAAHKALVLLEKVNNKRNPVKRAPGFRN